MGFSKSDCSRNACMLTGRFQKKGYDWWWHSFTGKDCVTGEEKAFFVEFFLCNPAKADIVPVLGQLPANKLLNRKPSYLMVKAGCWGKNAKQIHRFFSWNDVSLHPEAPFSVKAEDCEVSETLLKGSVCVSEEEANNHPEYMSQPGIMSWNLQVKKLVPFNVGYGAGKLFRDLKAFEMYWHAEGMKTKYSGSVMLDGREYEVLPEQSYGYADKNWGSDFTSPWVWLSSNHLYSKLTGKQLQNSVFDIGGGKPKVLGIPLNRKLLSAFYYEGKEYEFNFSKVWTGTKTKFECKETETELIWKVRQETFSAIMSTEVHCKKSDMLFVNYEAPDGTKRHNRLWNGGNAIGRIRLYKKKDNKRILIDDIVAKNIGCEYGEMD